MTEQYKPKEITAVKVTGTEVSDPGNYLKSLAGRGRERLTYLVNAAKSQKRGLVLAGLTSVLAVETLIGCAAPIESPGFAEKYPSPSRAPVATFVSAEAREVKVQLPPTAEKPAPAVTLAPDNLAQSVNTQATAEAVVQLASQPTISARQRATYEDNERFANAPFSTFINYQSLSLENNAEVIQFVKANLLAQQSLRDSGINPDTLSEDDFIPERPPLSRIKEVLESMGVQGADAERFQVGRQIAVEFRKADGSIGIENFTIVDGPTNWAARQLSTDEPAIVGKSDSLVFVKLQVCGNGVTVPLPVTPTEVATLTVTPVPTETATPQPTLIPTIMPTPVPTEIVPTPTPTATAVPTERPREEEETPVPATPTKEELATPQPTPVPPTAVPTEAPTVVPTKAPTPTKEALATPQPTAKPPTVVPTPTKEKLATPQPALKPLTSSFIYENG